jgi:hypothetical protein
VRPSRVLLLVSAAVGALSVLAAVFSAGQASMRCGVVTLAALTGYASVAGRAAPPRVRWGLAAGIGLLTVVAGLRLSWYADHGADFGWFAYAPLNNEAPSALTDYWRRTIDRAQLAAIGLLLGVLCLAVAVVALPVRHRPWRAVPTTVLAALLLAAVGVSVWSQVGPAPLLDVVGGVWPALLGTLLAAGILAVAGRRADPAWLLPVGALLVALTATTALAELAGTWSSWWTFSHIMDDNTASAMLAVSVDDSPAASGVWAAAPLAGPALFAIGALRASRAAQPAEL